MSCRSCGAHELETVLALGSMPLANAIVDKDDPPDKEPRHPLTFAICRTCTLAQILESVSPELLFSDYSYFSSYSDTMLRHAEESTQELIHERKLAADSLVLEIASNDGYQLRFFVASKIPVIGIDPAANVAEVAERNGIPTRVEFFTRELAARLRQEGVRPDVLLAYNVLAHVPDPNGFVAGIRELIVPDGIAVIEVPHVERLLADCEFDTIYHEHHCYFSLSSLSTLVSRHGLEVFRVEEIPIHGGSLRAYLAPAGAEAVESGVANILSRESERGFLDGSVYRGFAQRVEALRTRLCSLIEDLHGRGKRIAAYGAAAKGAILLNYFSLAADRIDFVADRSPHKQGHCMPGVRIPIVDPERLTRERPDYCLLLAWNLADEIIEQQRAYADAGGRFIVPLPELRII